MKKIWNKKKILPLALMAVLFFTSIFCYISDYYQNDEDVQEYLSSSDTISKTEIQDGLYWNAPEKETKMTYQEITPQEAKEIMDTESDIIILDVRTTEEYASGHIKNAICLPNEEIKNEPELLPDKEQQILVYCRSGNRSKQAAQKLADMGYENILEFGGILDWPYTVQNY